MNQLKDDVQKFYAWARKEYEGEEIELDTTKNVLVKEGPLYRFRLI